MPTRKPRSLRPLKIRNPGFHLRRLSRRFFTTAGVDIQRRGLGVNFMVHRSLAGPARGFKFSDWVESKLFDLDSKEAEGSCSQEIPIVVDEARCDRIGPLVRLAVSFDDQSDIEITSLATNTTLVLPRVDIPLLKAGVSDLGRASELSVAPCLVVMPSADSFGDTPGRTPLPADPSAPSTQLLDK